MLLARQRFLAETLLHALELTEPRLLVIAPPRRWDPSELWADELVTAIRRAPWLNPVSLDEAVRPERTDRGSRCSHDRRPAPSNGSSPRRW